MIEVKAFRCSDGSLRTSEYEAHIHDCFLRTKDIISKGAAGNGTTVTVGQAAMIFNNQFKALQSIYMECEKKLNRMARLQKQREKRAGNKKETVISIT